MNVVRIKNEIRECIQKLKRVNDSSYLDYYAYFTENTRKSSSALNNNKGGNNINQRIFDKS